MVDDDDERTQHKGACIERLKKKGESQRLYKWLSIDEGNRHVWKEENKKKKNRPNKTTDALTLKKEKIRQRESWLSVADV
jgi:hypothetical protein